MSLVERYTFGTTEHLVLTLLPCTASRRAAVDTHARTEPDVRAAARRYIARGWSVVPLRAREKACRDSDWLTRAYGPEDFGPEDNIGLKSTNGLVDMDSDCLEAAFMAEVFLPKTPAVYGRQSRPRSHWLFQCPDIGQPIVYKDLKKTILELRVNHQSMAPPSIHPEGERVGWDDPHFLASEAGAMVVDEALLVHTVQLTATGAMVAKYYNPPGARHEWGLALAGCLKRLGVEQHDAERLFTRAAAWVKDDKVDDRRRELRDTYKQPDDAPMIGGRKLAELMGEHGQEFVATLYKIWGQEEASGQSRIELINAADVKVVKLRWLWRARLAYGAITLLEGASEKGKSMVLTDLAARVSKGHSLPNEQDTREPGNVVMLVAEDDHETTVVPRLLAAGADLRRVFFLGVTRDERGHVVPFHLSDDSERLRARCVEVGASFVIVDPLVSYLGSRSGRVLNTNNDLEVRKSLAPLKDLAEQLGAPVVAIRHYRKGSGTDALEAGGGSVGFTALVRVVIAALEDPRAEEEGHYLLAVAKNNLVAKSQRPAVAYEIVPSEYDADIGRISWGKTVDMSAGEVLMAHAEARRDTKGKAAEAKAFLETFLGGGAWIPQPEVMKAAKEMHGVSEDAVRRAKAKLPIRVERHGAKWEWRLETERSDDKAPF